MASAIFQDNRREKPLSNEKLWRRKALATKQPAAVLRRVSGRISAIIRASLITLWINRALSVALIELFERIIPGRNFALPRLLIILQI